MPLILETSQVKILIVETSPKPGTTSARVWQALRSSGGQRRGGSAHCAWGDHHLLILDVMLPSMNGGKFYSCGAGLEMPVLFPDAGTVEDRIKGAGAGR